MMKNVHAVAIESADMLWYAQRLEMYVFHFCLSFAAGLGGLRDLNNSKNSKDGSGILPYNNV